MSFYLFFASDKNTVVKGFDRNNWLTLSSVNVLIREEGGEHAALVSDLASRGG